MRVALSLLITLLMSLGFAACCFLHELLESETSIIHIPDRYFVTSAQLQTFTEEESFKSQKGLKQSLLRGHRILPGQHVVLLLRDFYDDPWGADEEHFRKLTVELMDYGPQEELKIPSSKIRIFYSEGSPVWGTGKYATSGTGKIIIRAVSADNNSMVVFLDLQLNLRGNMGDSSKLTTIEGKFHLQRRELSALDDWLGGEGDWRKGWAEVNEPLETYLQRLESNDPQTRYLAAYQLSNFKSKSAVKALVTALRKESDAGVRRSILAALKLMDDRSVTPEFLNALKDCNPRVRLAAIAGLERLGDASILPALKEALDDKNYLVQQSAQQAITRLESKKSDKQ